MKRCNYDNDVCEVLCEHPQTICLARAEMVPEIETQKVTDVFRLLGDMTRFKIVVSTTFSKNKPEVALDGYNNKRAKSAVKELLTNRRHYLHGLRPEVKKAVASCRA